MGHASFYGQPLPGSSGKWRWQLFAATATDQRDDVSFAARFDAEAWLGEHAERLRAANVTSAQLLQDDQPVGPPVELSSNYRG